MKVTIRKKNLEGVRKSLATAKKKVDDLRPVARQTTIYLLGLVQRAFASNSEKARKWEPLSPVTLFIRRHRANAPTSSARPLNDRGLLRNANFPFVRKGGDEFGVVNNLAYAATQQSGGHVPPSQVLIKNFKRRTRTGLSKVIKKFYVMKLKGGKVPARPFFPDKEEYLPGIKLIMNMHAKGALNSTFKEREA